MTSVSAAAAVHAALAAAAATVATAESLTGGRLAGLLTGIPGASATYVGGVVAYATRVKQSLLGVTEEVVRRHGVVSPECAEAMARGVRELTGATYAVSTTGVAGPDGQEGQPVGTLHVGLSSPSGGVVRSLRVPGDRARVRQFAVVHALDMLRRSLSGLPAGDGTD